MYAQYLNHIILNIIKQFHLFPVTDAHDQPIFAPHYFYQQCSTASSSLSPPSLALSALSTTFSTLSSSLSSSSTSSPGPSTTSASSGTFSPRRHWFNFSLFFQTCCFVDIMIGCFLRKLLLIRIIITQYNTTNVSCDNQHQSQNLPFVLQENLNHLSGLCRLPKPFVC